MLVSVVIPCYNSQATIGKVVDLVTEEFDKNPGYACEFVLVNDHSGDGTFGVIRRLAQERENVKGIDLLRNFGQHNALMPIGRSSGRKRKWVSIFPISSYRPAQEPHTAD